MVIAVENGLDDIKGYLSNRGYQVIPLESFNPCDAAVYKSFHIANIPSPVNQTKNAGESHGTFLVCAIGKTPQEIESILRQKVYHNLF